MELLEREERPAYVRFERRPLELKAKSLETGRKSYIDVDWILVTPPYSRDVFEDKAENWLEKQGRLVKNGRVPQKFLDYWTDCYEKWKIGQEPPVNGTDIRNWSAVSPAEIKTMQAVGIRTIEDMASCNAEGLNRIGMGARKLKDLAEAWLKGADDRGAIVMENAELKRQLDIAEKDNETLREQVRILKYQLENANKVDHSGELEWEPYQEISVRDILDTSLKDKVLELEDLQNMYKERFGRKAASNMTATSIRSKLGI